MIYQTWRAMFLASPSEAPNWSKVMRGDEARHLYLRGDGQQLQVTFVRINQAQLDWPRREGFSCKRIEEHKQESINAQSKIANINEAKVK